MTAKEAWVYLVMIVLGLLSYKFLTGQMANIFALVLVIGGVMELVHGTALKSVEKFLPTLSGTTLAGMVAQTPVDSSSHMVDESVSVQSPSYHLGVKS